MKRILKQGVYRTKCPYCDCEFEYEKEDVVSRSLKNSKSMWDIKGFFSNIQIGALVSCPRCHNALYHAASSKSNITTEQL